MIIRIENIETEAVIGTLDHERLNPQKIMISIVFEYDASEAASSDNLKYGIDYSNITERVIRMARESGCYLIESLAEKIAGVLKSDSRITSGSVEVKKPSAIKDADYVSAKTNF